MRWLYRLQSRLGLAAPEGTAALVIVLALAAGTVARHVQASAAPPAPDLLAASDAAFEAADRAARSGALVRPVSSGAPVPPSAPSEPDPAPGPVPPPEAPSAAPAPAPDPPARRAASGPVRTGINTASAEDLERLPGIGPALAGRILDYRRQHGRFSRADQLVEVKGIGPKTFEKMKPWVVVD